jgi:hypothetical protein
MPVKRLILSAMFAAVLASPAVAKGPPWVSIEMRPYGAGFLTVRTWHHGTPMALPLTGTAEGLIDGRRSSVPLRFEHTDRDDANAFTLANTWGTAGVWVLNIGTDQGEHGSAGVVVGIDRSGGSAFVRFPRAAYGNSRVATRGEIDTMLRALDAGQPVPALTRAWFPLVVRSIAPLLVLGTAVTLVAKLSVAALRRMRPRMQEA